MKRTKIITITLGYDTEEEFRHILAGIREALPPAHTLSVEQWIDLEFKYQEMED